MPKDYIASSRRINDWLDKEKITIEVDTFASAVWENNFDMPLVDFWGDIAKPHRLCPYFGPGGEGNSLKALRGWCKKNACYFGSNAWHDEDDDVEWFLQSWELKEQIYGLPPYEQEYVPIFQIQAEGKTDGIALHDLLYKLMEEKG